MKLYEIAQNYKNLLELLDDETIPAEVVAQALQEVGDELEVKADNVVKFIKTLEHEVEAYKAEEKRLATNRKAIETKIETMKAYLLTNMQSTGKKEITTPLFKLKIAKTPASVKITDELAIPQRFIKENITYTISKTDIKEALKNGEIVEGATLEAGERLNIK